MKIGKKVAISVIALSTILMINTKAQAAQKVKVNTDTLKLRKEASTTSDILDLLSMDEVYEVVDTKGDWYKIKVKDKVGYVKKEYVKLQGETTSSTTKKEETPKQEEKKEEPKPEPEKEPVQEPEPTPEEKNETPADVQNGSSYTVSKKSDLKSLPLFGAVTLEELPKGNIVTVITRKNHWAYIETEAQTGWILCDNLADSDAPVEPEKVETPKQEEKKEETKPEPEKEPVQEPEVKTKTGYINSDDVNFRSKASTSSDVIKKLKLNTELKILSEDDKWCKVEVNGKTGYVSKDYVSSTKKEVTSRSLEEPRQVAPVEEKEEEPKKEKETTVSGKGEEVVELAKTYLGNKYIWAAAGPTNFDCSGFTMFIYGKFGVSITHSAAVQLQKGTAVEKSELQAGDAVFFQDSAKTKVGHVGIYMGDGNFIHSSSAVGEVTITPLSKAYYVERYVGARRYV